MGLGFKSVNWFEQAHYNMLLKKLFTQWDLILKSGQSVSQAYQNIADDLGAVTSSMAYSSALKSQMNLQKNLMTKNLDNRFSLAGQVVSLFNTVQNERFESLMQGIKYAAAKGMNYQYQKYINSKSKHFATSKGEASGMMGKFSDAALYNFVQLFEELYRVAIGAVRRTQLANQQDRLMSRAEKQYAGNLSSGSFFESLLYVSNVKKAKHKVNSDIINKIKYYDGFKTVVANLNDKWQKTAQKQAKKDLAGGGNQLKDQGDILAKALTTGDYKTAQKMLLQFSSFLTDSKASGQRYLSLPRNFLRSLVSVFSRKSEKSGS